MNCCTRLMVAAVVSIIFIGCRDNAVAPPLSGPTFIVSDGANHSGNPDFFFLPPLVKNPNNSIYYEPAAFNPNLKPKVVICVLDLGTHECVLGGTPFKEFGPAEIALNATDQMYSVNWRTDSPALNLASFYRIQVIVGGKRLGFADVDPVSNMGSKQLQNAQTGEYIPLVDGRTLPIKFRIETGALCDRDDVACTSGTINLNTGGTIELVTTGEQHEDFKFDIRPGTTASFGGQPVTDITFNLELCNGLDFDLKTFGPCLQIKTFFNGEGSGELTFDNKNFLLSLCVLNSVYHTPDETRQEDLITLHQQDGTLIRALPHASPNCGTGTIGVNTGGWSWLRQLAARLLVPSPAYAESRSAMNAVLHVGAGGESGSMGSSCTPAPTSQIPDGMQLSTVCPPSSPAVQGAAGAAGAAPQGATTAVIADYRTLSKFQFALPAKMEYIIRGDVSDADRIGSPDAVLPTGVKVTDWDGAAVQGATIRFYTPAIEGEPTLLATVVSGVDGTAEIPWTIHAGDNFLIARGRGVAGPNNYPPRSVVRPFSPDIDHPPEQPVALGAFGQLNFHATGGQPDLVITNLVVGPRALTFADYVTYDVTVQNQGNAPAGPSHLFIDGPSRLDGGDVGADMLNVPALAAGASITVQSRLGPRAPGGTSVTANADQNNEVAESNESNNSAAQEFSVIPEITFETLGNGTPTSSIALPLALVNDYAPQGLTFSYIQFDGTPGVASLCNSRAVDPEGITNNHSATIQGSGDPCSGWTMGEVVITFDPAKGLPTVVRLTLRGNASQNPFPLVGFDAAGNGLDATVVNSTPYTSNNGFDAREDIVEIRSEIGIAGIASNQSPVVVFLDNIFITR